MLNNFTGVHINSRVYGVIIEKQFLYFDYKKKYGSLISKNACLGKLSSFDFDRNSLLKITRKGKEICNKFC